ncbi:MAG: MBL fold metallo-hydrolase [Hyphomicrobium sp.]|nr:MBL fold metallo-hydrolase [Hyphomicrobium sp.]PPC83070.1 MAG: MBL fold metallo-hydrolase [Hyphomicrobium sp.]
MPASIQPEHSAAEPITAYFRSFTVTYISRRAFGLSLAGASAAALPLAAALSRGAAARTTPAAKSVPPLAQIRVGRFEVTALSDGYADMPFGYFTGRSPADIETAATAAFAARKGNIRLAFNQFLVRDGGMSILIDAGPNGQVGQSGRLPEGLNALGVKRSDIDAVILTHLHVDHIAGLVAGGRKVFPNAEIYADRRDVAHWTDAAKRAAAPDFLKSSFDTAALVMRLYPKLNRIDGEREISRGISIVDLTGHTPGHIGVRIADGADSLTMVSDMMFHPTLHPGAADIGFVFEQDPAAARAMRERFFPRALEDKTLIAATHMPFPGLGRIVRDGDRNRWLPTEWGFRA